MRAREFDAFCVFLSCLVVNQENVDSVHLQKMVIEASVQLLAEDEIQR
jgi:hypothetical protein